MIIWLKWGCFLPKLHLSSHKNIFITKSSKKTFQYYFTWKMCKNERSVKLDSYKICQSSIDFWTQNAVKADPPPSRIAWNNNQYMHKHDSLYLLIFINTELSSLEETYLISRCIVGKQNWIRHRNVQINMDIC